MKLKKLVGRRCLYENRTRNQLYRDIFRSSFSYCSKIKSYCFMHQYNYGSNRATPSLIVRLHIYALLFIEA